MIRAIIIDDEATARKELNNLLQESCPQVDVVGLASSALEGIELINSLHPDVIFLDIEMPGENGFNLLERYDKYDFSVIFTTAYHQYAIKAIRFCALDYLLKPIQKTELTEAVERIGHLKYSSQQLKNLLDNMNRDSIKSIVLNTHDDFVVAEIDEILRFEAERNYTFVHFLNGNKLLMSKTLLHFEELLGADGFLRCHRSHLVNMKYVKRIAKQNALSLELTNSAIVPVSHRRKSEVLRSIER